MTDTITHSHGFLTDCESTTSWTETEDGLTAALTSDGDIFDIYASAEAGNKTVYYEYDFSNISSDTYTAFLARYKTSDSSIKAKIVLVFTAGSQTILDETSSTSWALATATPTPSKTIDKIQLWATQATGHVYYDFALLYKNNFTIPDSWKVGPRFSLMPKDPFISIPGRTTNINQRLGTENLIVSGTVDLDKGTWERTSPADTIPGQIFWEHMHESHSEPWQWLTLDDRAFKATTKCEEYYEDGFHLMDLTFTEYSLGSKNSESAAERWTIT